MEVEEEERGPLFYTLSALLACTRPSEFCPLLVELSGVDVRGVPMAEVQAHGAFLALVINKAQRDQCAVFVLR